jgi:hypothetical protein
MKVTAAATAGAVGYQWYKDNVAIAGATSGQLPDCIGFRQHVGAERWSLTNGMGSATSATAQVTIVGPPVVYAEPASLVVPFGGTATITAKVLCVSSFSYRWNRNGVAVGVPFNAAGGATPVTMSYTISNATSDSEGLYSVTAYNAQGAVETHPP